MSDEAPRTPRRPDADEAMEDTFNQEQSPTANDPLEGPLDPEDFDEAARALAGQRRSGGFSRALLLCIVCIASLATLWLLREDACYFFAERTPVYLGFADQLDAAKAPASGTLVTVKGVRHFQRLLLSNAARREYFFPFIGSDKIFVLSPADFDEERVSAHGIQSDAPYTGRLLRLEQMRNFEKIASWYGAERNKELDPAALVIEERKLPKDQWWVVLSCVMLLLSAGISGWRAAHIFRRK